MDERGGHLRVAFLGSWVPRRCGIATFTKDLRDAIEAIDPTTISGVLAIDEPGALRHYDATLIARVRQYDETSYQRAAGSVRAWGADVVNVQHEFGLYGSGDGATYTDHLAGFLRSLRVPAITTLHTVRPDPPIWMREVVRTIARTSAAIIVMSATARRILVDHYGLDHPAILIPHGAPPITRSPGSRAAAKKRLGLAGRNVISTFGLVDPRKGLEYAIEAMGMVVREHPDAIYVVAGQTHPALIDREGEPYRAELVRRVAEHGLKDHVRFIDQYLTLETIVELLCASDAYVTPYLDPDQITSGTLAYAIGAGCAIVSTRYLHATEALGEGRGILVDFRSPDQIAAALLGILGSPSTQRALEERAYAYGRQATWPRVGAQVLAHMSSLAAHSRLAPTRHSTASASIAAPSRSHDSPSVVGS